MYKQKFAIILFVSFVLLSTSTANAQEEEAGAEIERLIRAVSVDTQRGAFSNYTYLMRFSYERHRKMAGRKFTRLYEAILPAKFATNRVYAHQILLLEDSEQRLTEQDIMLARQNIARELEKAEREAENQPVQAQVFEDGGYWSTSFQNEGKKIKIDVLKMLQCLKFNNLQRQKVDGKDIATIDFSPKTDVLLDKAMLYLAKLEGRITIDEADKRIIRIEGYAPGEFAAQRDKPDAERQKGMIFLFSQMKVAEGFWFPQTVMLNFAKHPEIFDPIEVQYSFIKYKKASVDVRDTIETPKEPTQTTPATTDTKGN
jgi:hypothetical protein